MVFEQLATLIVLIAKRLRRPPSTKWKTADFDAWRDAAPDELVESKGRASGDEGRRRKMDVIEFL